MRAWTISLSYDEKALYDQNGTYGPAMCVAHTLQAAQKEVLDCVKDEEYSAEDIALASWQFFSTDQSLNPVWRFGPLPPKEGDEAEFCHYRIEGHEMIEDDDDDGVYPLGDKFEALKF